MKTKKGFMLRSVAGRHVVVAIGQASVDFNGLITLNDTGAYIWERLAKGTTYEDLLKDMLSDYEVDEETAKSGIDAFLKTARDAELLDEN
ncbi:MAG: PqqD family protein [Clostridia bacterium]|nr:PqqD family protein [Clostridia bacterium]